MPHSIKTAAIQMDATVAPLEERLKRADKLIVQAAESGAQLVLLPELFNSGYGYTDENFQRAEPLNGRTATWLKQTAATLHIHLAGSLMILEEGEIFNVLLLFAPDGKMWRYDKNYPWGWERGFFRGRANTTVADTDLGKIGMLICWDASHRNLWAQYAGKVDLMIVCSCPPEVSHPTFSFPNGDQVTFDDFGPLGQQIKGTGRKLFGDMINQQTGWLGVPAVCTVGTGHIKTPIPNGLMSVISYLPVAPKLIRHLRHGNGLKLECDFVQGCKIVDGNGLVLTELEQEEGEAFTAAEIKLNSERPKPNSPQPKSNLAKITYLSSDVILPLLMRPVYRRGLRQLSK